MVIFIGKNLGFGRGSKTASRSGWYKDIFSGEVVQRTVFFQVLAPCTKEEVQLWKLRGKGETAGGAHECDLTTSIRT